MVGTNFLFVMSTACALTLIGSNAYECFVTGRFTTTSALGFTIAATILVIALRRTSFTATPLNLNWGNITIEWNKMDRVTIYRDSPRTSTIHIFTTSHPPRHVELQLFNDELPVFAELIHTHAPGGNCLRVELENDLGDKT